MTLDECERWLYKNLPQDSETAKAVNVILDALDEQRARIVEVSEYYVRELEEARETLEDLYTRLADAIEYGSKLADEGKRHERMGCGCR